MPNRLPRPARGEPREIAELRRLKADSPDLASAIDLQIGLLEIQRRVQARVPLPAVSGERMRQRQRTDGVALLLFEDIPLDWSDFRLLFRETAELLRRHDALPEEDLGRALALTREGNALEPLVRRWYQRTAGGAATGGEGPDAEDSLAQIIQLAMRPFLARCAEAVFPQLDLAAWGRPRCPLCAGEPEFATITPAAERCLICARCGGQWPFHPLACPFCGNEDRRAITSFATRDGRYRIYACDACQRYVKAYDGRAASRPVMIGVDTIATLPLDAAAMQRGYRAE